MVGGAGAGELTAVRIVPESPGSDDPRHGLAPRPAPRDRVAGTMQAGVGGGCDAGNIDDSSSSCWDTLPTLCWVPAGGPVTEGRLEELLVESFSHLAERRSCDCASCTAIVSLLSHLAHHCPRATADCTVCRELCQLMRRHALLCSLGSLCPVVPCAGLGERLARRATLCMAEVPGWDVSRDLEFVRGLVAPLLADAAFRPWVAVEFGPVADAEPNDAAAGERRADGRAAEAGREERRGAEPDPRAHPPRGPGPSSRARSGIASIFLPPLCEAVEMISPMEQLMFGLKNSALSNSEDNLFANQENIQAMLMYINGDYSNSGIQLPDVVRLEDGEPDSEGAKASMSLPPAAAAARANANGEGPAAKAYGSRLRKSDSLPLTRANRPQLRVPERRPSNCSKAATVRSHASLRVARSVCLSAVPVSVRGLVCVGKSRELRELTVHWESLGLVSDAVCEGVLLNKELSPVGGSYREGQQWEKTPRQLGHGRFGNVFVGRDLRTSFQFAVKQLSVEKFLENELSIWSRLDSPRLVQLYGAVREGPRLSLLMQVVEGGTLDVMISDNKQLPQDLAIHYTCQVLEALEYLHQNNVLHADVKADNILMSADGNQLWLCDFGFSQLLRPGSKVLAKDQQPRGTQTHMAPEVAASAGHDCKADVWSACCVLLHMLNGRHPWMERFPGVKVLYFVIVQQEAPVSEAPEGCAPCVLELLRSGLQKDPAARPTASWLLSQARDALNELGGLDTVFSYQDSTSGSMLVSGGLTGRLVSLINRRALASAGAGGAQLASLGQRSTRASFGAAPALGDPAPSQPQPQAPPQPQPPPQTEPRRQTPELARADPASFPQPLAPPRDQTPAPAGDVRQTPPPASRRDATSPSSEPLRLDERRGSRGPETVSERDAASPRPERAESPGAGTHAGAARSPADARETGRLADASSRAGAARPQTRTLISVDSLESSILKAVSLGVLPAGRRSHAELPGRALSAPRGDVAAHGASGPRAGATMPARRGLLEGGAELRAEEPPPARLPLRRMPARHSDPQAVLDDMQKDLMKQLSVPNPAALHDALFNSLIADSVFMPYEEDAESIHSLPESPQLPSTVHLKAVRVDVLNVAGEHAFTLVEQVGVTVEEVAIGIKEQVALPAFTLTWPDGTEVARHLELREPSVTLRYVAAGDPPGLAWTWRVNGGHLEKRPLPVGVAAPGVGHG